MSVPVLVEADPGVAQRLAAVLGSGVVMLRDVDALRVHVSVDVDESVVVLGPSVEFALATDFARWAGQAHPGVGVIVVRREGAASVSAEALRAGIRDVVNEPDHAGLIVAVRRSVAVRDLAIRLEGEIEGGVVTVFAGERGSGTTMVAITLAAGLARGGRRVCLVDLAQDGGEVASALRLTPERGMGDLLPIAGVLDQAKVAGIVTPYASGFDVVLAPRQPGMADSISAELSERVLRLLGEAYDFVVIDTPPRFDAHILGAVNLTDVLVLPTRLDIPGLIGLRRAMEDLDRITYPRERRRMLLVESATDTDVLVTETEKSLGMSFWERIPLSPDVAAGGRRGLPIVRADPTNEINEPSQRSAGEYPANTGRVLRHPAAGHARHHHRNHRCLTASCCDRGRPHRPTPYPRAPEQLPGEPPNGSLAATETNTSGVLAYAPDLLSASATRLWMTTTTSLSSIQVTNGRRHGAAPVATSRIGTRDRDGAEPAMDVREAGRRALLEIGGRKEAATMVPTKTWSAHPFAPACVRDWGVQRRCAVWVIDAEVRELDRVILPFIG